MNWRGSAEVSRRLGFYCDLVKGSRIWPDMPHRNTQRKLELTTPANLMPTKHLSSYQQDSFFRSGVVILQRVTTSFSNTNLGFSGLFVTSVVYLEWYLKQITFISNSVMSLKSAGFITYLHLYNWADMIIPEIFIHLQYTLYCTRFICTAEIHLWQNCLVVTPLNIWCILFGW